LSDIKRQANTQIGLPYSVLANRFTFPLALEGHNTSFYGRATWRCDARSKHRKLSTEQTGVPHGAFNINILASEDYPEIVIAEGVFDALSLMQMGYKATIAMIGVNNTVILESISRSAKNLAIALDHDQNETGQNNTKKIIDRLKAMNYTAHVRNFTQDFIASNHDFLELNCKDFNEYLTAKTKTAP
jgi:DNA primase